MDNINEKYISKNIFEMGKDLIVLDKVQIHECNEIKTYYSRGNKKLIFILSRITLLFHSLDLNANKLFKRKY